MKAAVERITGRRVLGVAPVARGYAHNQRAIATLERGQTVFVKQAVDDDTAQWLRREHAMYEAIAGALSHPTCSGLINEYRQAA